MVAHNITRGDAMTRSIQLAVVASLLGAGCVKVSDGEIIEREAVMISETNLVWFDDPLVLVPAAGQPVEGTRSVLLRTETDLALFHETSGLPPGNVFHFWYGAFQAPDKCEMPNTCTRFDIPNPRVNFTSIFGRISATVDAQGRLRATAKPAKEGDATFSRFGQGIRDTISPQIMGFVRDHGPILPELYDQQTGGDDGRFYDGGCKESGVEGADFDCFIPQIANHYRHISEPAGATTRSLIWVEHDGDPRSGREVGGSRAVVASSSKLMIGFVDSFGFPPSNAISMWWAVFGNPDACAAGAGACTLADLSNPATAPQVVDSGIGAITPFDGTYLATVAPVYFDQLEPSSSYEVLLVLRNHGLSTDEHYVYQRYGMNAGCELDGRCSDVQYSRHQIVRTAL